MKNYENIPTELKSLNQWVCAWNNSKVPMQADKLQASSSSNSALWSSFEDARDSVEIGNYDNIGFVFDDNGIVGIDIDVGFDNEHIMSELAYDIITHCKSYTEYSRSGRGFHIYLKGELPFKGKNNGTGVEIYKDDRYFIVTGEKCCYSDLIANQEAINYVVDKYFKDIPKEEPKTFDKLSYRIYQPEFKIVGSKISMPTYPKMIEGSRHMSMVSLAGQLHNSGASVNDIFNQLIRINDIACDKPLPRKEIETIVKSIVKYERK